MRKTVLGVAVAILALLSVPAPAPAQSNPSFRAQWNRPVAPFRIAGPIYYVGVEGIGSYLIATPQGHILIDGGFEETAPLILANIRALGFRPRDVKLLLITHAHFDHAGGLAALKAATGARLLAVEQERLALERGRHFGDNTNGVGRFAPVKVDRALRDGEAIAIGGAVITAHRTPGHTRGCTSFTLPVVEAGVRHTAIFYCSTTVAGNVLVGNRAYPGIVADYRSSFATLKRIDADIFLTNHPNMADVAGKHARMGAGRPNPFVVRGEMLRFVAASERDFDAELARQQKAKRR